MDCSTPGFPVLHHLLEPAQTHVHRVSDAIQPSHPLSPLSLSFDLSQHQGLFQWVSSSNQVAQSIGVSTSALVLPIQGWFSLGFPFLAVKGIFKCILQHHNSKASVLWCSVFFKVHLSHPYLTTGKTIALTRWTFVGKVMSLLFNMLSKFVIAFLPRSKCLLISWLQSPSAVVLEPKKIKDTCSLKEKLWQT